MWNELQKLYRLVCSLFKWLLYLKCEVNAELGLVYFIYIHLNEYEPWSCKFDLTQAGMKNSSTATYLKVRSKYEECRLFTPYLEDTQHPCFWYVISNGGVFLILGSMWKKNDKKLDCHLLITSVYTMESWWTYHGLLWYLLVVGLVVVVFFSCTLLYQKYSLKKYGFELSQAALWKVNPKMAVNSLVKWEQAVKRDLFPFFAGFIVLSLTHSYL